MCIRDRDGYQQTADTGIAACLKHFAGYGAVDAGREYNDVEISQRTFLEQYVKPVSYTHLVYNAYNGQTETMEAKWANLKKMEEETFAKIITEMCIRDSSMCHPFVL